MKNTKKQFDFRLFGGIALIVVFAIGCLLVGGNNQRANASPDSLKSSALEISGAVKTLNELQSELNAYFGVEMGMFGGVTNYDSLTLGDDLIVGGTSTFTGTTTLAKSPDGFIAWDDFTIATSGVAAVYTNNAGPMMCDDTSGAVYASSDDFVSSLTFSLGTSTSATKQTAIPLLIASTTMATTTGSTARAVVHDMDYAAPFRLASGESIVGLLGDGGNTEASTSPYANLTMEFGIHCWLMGE